LCLRFKSPGHNHKSEECQNCKGDGAITPADRDADRPKAEQPWLAAGISRSTWYRRQKKAREQAAMARQAALDRLERQLTALRTDLERAALCG